MYETIYKWNIGIIKYMRNVESTRQDKLKLEITHLKYVACNKILVC